MICDTCEVLQLQVEKLSYQNEQLMNRILNPIQKDIPSVNRDEVSEMKIPSAHIPWRVRQQLLEKEDREKARLMKDAVQPIGTIEKEVLG